MSNLLELVYVRNGTQIALLNMKSKLYLNLIKSSSNFKVNGKHPFNINPEYQEEINSITKFTIVLSSMPNFTLNKERTPLKFGDQISLMTYNNLFLVCTNNGELKLEELKGDRTLTSLNLPINSKFILMDPSNDNHPVAKPLFFNDLVTLKSTFGGYLSLVPGLRFNMGQTANEEEKERMIAVTNNMRVMNESMFKIIKPNQPYIEDWFSKRKNINFNVNSYLYYLQEGLNSPPKVDSSLNSLSASKEVEKVTTKIMSENIDKNKAELGSFSEKEQEKLLVNDLILAMMGKEGTYIKRVVTNTSFQDFKVEFEVEPYLTNPTCAPSLLTITNNILPISFYYNSITNYINLSNYNEMGLISKAFSDALYRIIKEHLLFVNQLKEDAWKHSKDFDLHKLMWLCQNSLKILENIHKLCQKCMLIKGGALINILYNAYIREADNELKNIYKFLLDNALIPYLKSLQQWVCKGVLENNQEFMVQTHKSYNLDVLKERYFEMFWDIKFKLNKNNTPQFLDGIARKILFIGKTQNIIKECGYSIDCPYEKEFNDFIYKENFNCDQPQNNDFVDDVVDHNNLLFKRTGNKSNKSEFKSIFEAERLVLFNKLIDKIYDWTNEALKSILYNNFDLIKILNSFRDFFLGGFGHFYNQLLDITDKKSSKITEESLFEKSIKEVNISEFENFVDDALMISGLNLKFNKDLFSITITNIPLEIDAKFIKKYKEILNKNDPGTSEAIEELQLFEEQKKKFMTNLKLWEAINLDPTINWPLNLIFSKSNVVKYQLLFRQMFKIKFTQKALLQCFIVHKNLKEFSNQKYLQNSYLLRDAMLKFLHNLSFYFFNEVIETNFLQLINNIGNCKNIEEVINFHNQFLDDMINESFISDEEMMGNLNNILQCCYIFSRLIQRSYYSQKAEMLNSINYKKDKHSINKMDNLPMKEMNRIIEFSNKINGTFIDRVKLFINKLKELSTSSVIGQKFSILLTDLDYNDYYHNK